MSAYSQVVLSIANTNSFICTELNGFKYCYVILTIQFNIGHLFVLKWLNSSIWPIDWIQTDTTTSVSNGNEGVLNIPRFPELKSHHQMQ